MRKAFILEQELTCAQNHAEPIFVILQDQSLKIEQRLLCLACIKEFQSFPQSINFDEAKRIVQDKQDTLYENFCEKISSQLRSIEEFEYSIQELRQSLNKQLETLLGTTDNWKQNLLDLQNQQSCYSLLTELDRLGLPIEVLLNDQQQLIDQCNYSYFNKMQFSQKLEIIMNSLLLCKQELNFVLSYEEQNFIQFEKLNCSHNFQVNCTKHNSKIIFVDITKGSQNRLRCMHCGQGDAITINEFERRWDSYQKLKKTQDQEQRSQMIRDSFQKQSMIMQLMQEQQKGMNELIDNLNDSIFRNKLKSQQDSSVYDLLISMAEQISSNTDQDIQREEIRLNIDSLNRVKCLVNQFRSKIKSFSQKRVEMELISDQTTQKELCQAIAFSFDGSTMAAACENDIKIWKLKNGKLEDTQIKLRGHVQRVLCLVYSKQRNWIASSGHDQTIRLWKETDSWNSSQPGKMHDNTIFCLLMNQNEDQLISGSADKTIKVWNINYAFNKLIYDYSLDMHKNDVFSISMNESETTFVSCSLDKQILVWEKVQNQKWQFMQTIFKSVDQFGCRICFINDKMIAWQQSGQGYTHIFQNENGMFIEKPELRIELNQVGDYGHCLFPSVWNREGQILVQKQNQYVYIIGMQNGKFKIECEPIDCNSKSNYGGLTHDGKYLVIWNDKTKQFKVYQLKYQ